MNSNRMVSAKRLFLLLLCCCLLFSQAAAAKSETPSLIRVHLSRLSLGARADLTLEGRYLLRCGDGAELLLPSAARVTVLLRRQQLVFFCDGLSLSAGKKLSLLRRDAGAETGIRFHLQSGLYPGDLHLSVSDGAILPVLELPLETYLLGVVPYEMNDFFPPEALKAQAVCARTYALSKLSPKSAWDVTDTTNDQVFKAISPDNKNTALAVAETEGLVLTYKNKLITAWYSASNGGQTELPGHIWPGPDIPACFAVTEDPWDAENPESLTRSFALRRDGTDLPPAFLRLLLKTLEKDPELQPFRLEEDFFRVDALKSAVLTDPRYESPSRLMTRLRLTLDCSAALKPGAELPSPKDADVDITDLLPAAGGTPSPALSPSPAPDGTTLYPVGSRTVTLELFPDVITALGISISGANNEICTITESDAAFTLTAGRYGHGVGLSQRGAQWQAAEGNRTFREILSFYYPGAVLKKWTGEAAPPPTPDPLLAVTPGPAPTATPRPTLMPVTGELPEGAWLASVEGIPDDSSLNLRESPSPAGKILMRLYKHQRLIVLEETGIPGWVKVRTDAVEGYVMLSFLEKVK